MDNNNTTVTTQTAERTEPLSLPAAACTPDHVDLDEVAGRQLLKNQVQFHHRCALLGFIKIHPPLIQVILTKVLLI